MYNWYAGTCGDLGNMLSFWTSWFPGLPVVFTEDDWSTQPNSERSRGNVNGCEGTYLVDLFTWLYDHNCAGSQCDNTSSPVRVMWMRGADADLPLGIYTPNGGEKSIGLRVCSNGGINNSGSNISNDYYYLRHGSCY